MGRAGMALAMASGLLFGSAHDVLADGSKVEPRRPPEAEQPSSRGGLTFEINVGLGLLHRSLDNADDRTDRALAGLSLGVGAWIEPNVAATVRAAGVTYFGREGALSPSFLGASLQTWVSDGMWFGAGMGFGTLVHGSHEGR
jgi:hypothetical protein